MYESHGCRSNFIKNGSGGKYTCRLQSSAWSFYGLWKQMVLACGDIFSRPMALADYGNKCA